MKSRWIQLAAATSLVSALTTASIFTAHSRVEARSAAAVTATATSGFDTVSTATPTKAASFATATPEGRATPTISRPRRPVNPTPIASHRLSITLPKPVVLVVGTKTFGSGLSEAAAFTKANNPKNLVPFRIAPPTTVPKPYILQLIQVTPAQDQQTPAAVSLLYIPKGLSKVSGTYPSFTLYKQLGQSINLVNPGGKVQTITIRAGKGGIGVVKGQLVDMKFASHLETVDIAWQVNSVNYELTSVISLSKLTVKQLISTAGSFQ